MGDAHSDSSPVMYVPVPRDLFSEVMAFVAARLTSAGVSETPAAKEAFERGDPSFWTSERLRTLHEQLRYVGARSALTLAARHAPMPVSITQVERETSSRTAREIAADLGALTKLCRKLFQRRDWPMVADEMWSDEESRWCMHYKMHPEVAERWLALADAV